MMRSFLLIFSVFFLSPTAFAVAPVVTAITGVSNSNLVGTVTAWGGFGGPTCAPVDINTPCDSCVGGLVACNPTRSFNTLLFRVAASHTDAGNLIIVKTADNTAISVSPHNATDVSAPWSAVCAGIGTGGVADCEITTIKDGSVRVCVDKNLNNIFDSGEECADVKVKVSILATGGTSDIATETDGITDFVPYPGDEKIYIEDPKPSANFPNLSTGAKINGVRVYIGEDNMTSAAPGAGLAPKDLQVVEDGATLSDSIVDGLTNGKKYWFRIGLRDEANNIGFFWPPPGSTAPNYRDVNGKNCDVEECAYSATPDEVVGLLTEDVNCFIATAAYGTSFNEKLDTFREFRFKRLLPTEWGKRFVKSYYHYGPFAARYIHDKPLMRAATRGMLWPAYGFSRLALHFGLWQAVAISLFAMATVLALPLIGVRRFSQRG